MEVTSDQQQQQRGPFDDFPSLHHKTKSGARRGLMVAAVPSSQSENALAVVDDGDGVVSGKFYALGRWFIEFRTRRRRAAIVDDRQRDWWLWRQYGHPQWLYECDDNARRQWGDGEQCRTFPRQSSVRRKLAVNRAVRQRPRLCQSSERVENNLAAVNVIFIRTIIDDTFDIWKIDTVGYKSTHLLV